MQQMEILEKAIGFYGERSQIGVAQEECAELIQALSKQLRGKDVLDNIAEEMADVEIMLMQLKLIFQNDKRVEQWKVKKLSRLDDNISKSESMRYF